MLEVGLQVLQSLLVLDYFWVTLDLDDSMQVLGVFVAKHDLVHLK